MRMSLFYDVAAENIKRTDSRRSAFSFKGTLVDVALTAGARESLDVTDPSPSSVRPDKNVEQRHVAQNQSQDEIERAKQGLSHTCFIFAFVRVYLS